MAIDNPGEDDPFQPPFYGRGFDAPEILPGNDLTPGYTARHEVPPGEETLQIYLPMGVVPTPEEQLGAHAYERREVPFGFRRFAGLEPMFYGAPPIEYVAATGARFQEAVNGQAGALNRYQMFSDVEYDPRPLADGRYAKSIHPVYLEHTSQYGTAALRLTHNGLDVRFYAASGEETEARYVHDPARGLLCREVAPGTRHQRLVPVGVDEADYIISDLIAYAKPPVRTYDDLAGIICEKAMSTRPSLSSGEAWEANYLLKQVANTYRTASMSVEDILSGTSELARVTQADNGDLVSVVTDAVQAAVRPSEIPEYYIALNRTAHSRDRDLTGALAVRQHALRSDDYAVRNMTLYDRIWIYPSTLGPECVLDSQVVEDGSERVLSTRSYQLNAPKSIMQVLRNHVLDSRVVDSVMP